MGATTSFGTGSTDFLLIKFSSPSGGGIPGFDLLYLLCGLLALAYIVQRRKSPRSPL
ncbi:MAG TPA: hypothetical protein VMV49_07115 [Candidatus Deferrimicrobium sp.]|nr:hypothetical protein [Candidatus Deferrimicrobium sp.]